MREETSFIEIDGSRGEGGGQVLRSALALSIITGNPVHLYNIRAGREKPGLMAQHLKAVDAAAAVSKAEVHGAALLSQEIHFRPSGVQSGRYRFEIGTAGSTTLVLQTIFLPLSLAPAASSVIISGGTHVPWSPAYPYIEQHWLPLLNTLGFQAQTTLDQAGFYPQGGGRISAIIRPAEAIQPLQFTRRGRLNSIRGLAGVANLPLSIADRMKRQAVLRLQKAEAWEGTPHLAIKSAQLPSPGKGAFLMLLAECEGGQACYTALGEPGKPAERVADEAIEALLAYLGSGAAVDQYLADQLLLPLSLAQGVSEFTTCRVTEHLRTNAAILQAFCGCRVEVEEDTGKVSVIPAIIDGGK